MERPPELDETRAAGPRAVGGAGAWEPPAEFEEYRLVRPLGQGAMGRVFVAHDLLLDRLVAVKFVADDAPSAAGRERFFVEARALARLQHPNIVAVHRVGEVRRRPYLVSELLRGRILGELAAPLPPAEVLRIGVGLSRGLAAAHRRGVLHRDIKPHNAMVTEEGEVKLLDFGLAKLLDAAPGSAEPAAPGPAAPGSAEPAAPAASETGASDIAALAPGAARPSPALTQQGALVGSPLYLAPELWRGGAAPSRQSDVYSLGVVLYELCAGRPPFSGATLEELRERVLTGGAAPLPASAPPGAELAAVIDRCLRLDPAERPGSGDVLREALERLAAPPPLVPAGNPYRGLLRFEAEHRGLFFGRGAEVRAVLDRLREGGFVLVAGDSGVGKSSLCRAGALPACEEGALGAPLPSLRVTPGRRPLQALCAAVAPLLGARPGELAGEEQLLQALREDPAQLGRRLRQLATPPLLFVDQLEELVTLSDPEEAAACAAALGAVAESGGRLLCTARADFLSRLCGLPGLGPEVPRALWLLSPLSDDGLREAVEGPARAKGYAFEGTALVDELAAAGRGGALPLLQFALAELWEARDEERRLLTVSSLQTLGGVGGALGRHADGVLRRMLPPERICARRLLLGLVTADGTRSRKDARELLGGAPEPAAVAALDALVQGRLLLCSAAEEPGEAGAAPAVYELAHEALLSGWEMLGRWLTGDAELRALRQRLSYAAGEWRRLGGSEEALWRERQLREAQVLRDGDLQSREVAFVAASRRAVERGRWRRRLPLALVPLLLALGVALFQIAERRQVGRRVASLRAQALARLGEARGAAAAAAARREAALRRFDEGARAAAESDWGASLAQEAEADRGYGRAAQLLESALQLDGPRQDVAALRALLADVLSARAEGAARGQRPGQREELLDRLRLYDEGGARRARLLARARLTIESTPPATLRVEQAAPSGGRRDFAPLPGTAPAGEAARTPLTIELAPGTYRLTLSAPGRAEVRQVLRLLPGEARTESLPLPAAAAVPPGMIYVPAGAFLFGSAAEELRRGFLGTQPLRAARTGAFLIAQRETTFGDWLAFLRALPPAERARRRPRVGGPGMHGGLELREGPAGEFALRYQPTDEALSARAGEPLRYRGRAAHQSIDWLRLPVSGVDAEDAAAYAGWLRRSGRLPGARLCTEHEWERAARGADEREYPHGDRLEPDDANYDATHSGAGHGGLGLCEVGSHPASRSPFGVDDLAGNVWEWVVPVISRATAMARGGGYYYGDVVQRSTNRHEPEPTLRDATVGLRVCADAP